MNFLLKEIPGIRHTRYVPINAGDDYCCVSMLNVINLNTEKKERSIGGLFFIKLTHDLTQERRLFCAMDFFIKGRRKKYDEFFYEPIHFCPFCGEKIIVHEVLEIKR